MEILKVGAQVVRSHGRPLATLWQRAFKTRVLVMSPCLPHMAAQIRAGILWAPFELLRTCPAAYDRSGWEVGVQGGGGNCGLRESSRRGCLAIGFHCVRTARKGPRHGTGWRRVESVSSVACRRPRNGGVETCLLLPDECEYTGIRRILNFRLV